MSLSRRRFLQLGSVGIATLFTGKLSAFAARRQSNTLRVAWGLPGSLDPISASDDNAIAILNAVYDYLIETNAQSELLPRLAESWTNNDDATEYTVQLRQNVTFHDGSALTPDDVIWSFTRLRDEGQISLFAAIESMEAGENSVIFKLSQPNPEFPYLLSDNRAVILKTDAENIGQELNGTGPFVLSELTTDRAVMSANENYWGDASTIEALEFVFLADQEAQVNALRDGVVDVMLRLSNETFLSLMPDFAAISIPTNGHDLVRLRMDVEPGNDPKVVQAFKLATDRQAAFDRVQLGFGAVGRDTPIGPLYGALFAEEYDVPARDVEAAKQLLAEAGYEDGLDIKMTVPNTGNRQTLAEVLAAQWAEAGINVEIELVDEATYFSNEGDNWLTAKLGITNWGSRPTPQEYLLQAYKSGADWNETKIADPELDASIDTAVSTLDEEERIQAYKDIQRILIERGSVIIPYFWAQFMVTAPEISGIDLHPFAGRTNFNRATF